MLHCKYHVSLSPFLPQIAVPDSQEDHSRKYTCVCVCVCAHAWCFAKNEQVVKITHTDAWIG